MSIHTMSELLHGLFCELSACLSHVLILNLLVPTSMCMRNWSLLNSFLIVTWVHDFSNGVINPLVDDFILSRNVLFLSHHVCSRSWEFLDLRSKVSLVHVKNGLVAVLLEGSHTNELVAEVFEEIPIATVLPMADVRSAIISWEVYSYWGHPTDLSFFGIRVGCILIEP